MIAILSTCIDWNTTDSNLARSYSLVRIRRSRSGDGWSRFCCSRASNCASSVDSVLSGDVAPLAMKGVFDSRAILVC